MTPPPSDDRPEECLCPCHYPTQKLVMLHFAPCCQGRCSACGRWYKTGLEIHIVACGKQPPSDDWLRELAGDDYWRFRLTPDQARDLAAELLRSRGRVRELEAALRPLATLGKFLPPPGPAADYYHPTLAGDDLRRAQQALAGTPAPLPPGRAEGGG